MIDVQKTTLDGVLLITPRRFSDDRGFFSETYNARAFREAGVDAGFVQDNHSLSVEKGTVRGLHFQAPPFAQAKLVRVIRGAILDVAVDARKASPTYGKHISATLSSDNGAQLFIPEGFLHGFVTHAPNTEVVYKVNHYYDRDADGSVLWNDPDLAIDWGVSAERAVLSGKDKTAQSWADFKSPF